MAKMDDVKPVSSGYDFGDGWLGELEDALDFDENEKDENETHEVSPDPDNMDAMEEVMEVIDLSEDDFSNDNDVDLSDDMFESMPEIEMDLAFDTEDNIQEINEEVPPPPQPLPQESQ